VLTVIRYMHAAGTEQCRAGLASSGMAITTGVRELDSQGRSGDSLSQDGPAFS